MPVYDKPMVYYPLVDADARGDPRHPDDLDAGRTGRVSSGCSATAAESASTSVRGAAETRRASPQAFIIGREFIGIERVRSAFSATTSFTAQSLHRVAARAAAPRRARPCSLIR